jgi:hypothetical protein
MRWEFVPVIFGLAGAAGGALDALLSGVVMGKYGDTAGICAYIGGGIGLGIGGAMCLSRRFWVRLVAAPFFGVAGYFLLVCVSCLAGGDRDLPGLGKLLEDEFARYLAAPAAPVLVAAHHFHLRLRDRGRSPYASMALYAVMGAISGSIFWTQEGHVAAGLLDGALYGLCQHVGMIVALGLEKWRAEPEAAQGLSPRQ